MRPATPDDAPAVQAIYAPIVAGTAISFEVDVPDVAEMGRRIGGALGWLVAEWDGVVAGYAYASRHRERAAYQWSVETSVYVAPEQRAQGTGRLLYEALLPALADLGYVTAYAGVTLPNPASVRLHEALGFRPVGVFPRAGHKHGRWYDVGWWHLSLCDPPPTDPTPPRGWSPS